MLSIPDTIALHRATRDRYMDAARSARHDERGRKSLLNFLYYDKFMTAEKELRISRLHHERVFCKNAKRCFLRHARAANRKLVAVKRLDRMLKNSPYLQLSAIE